MNPSTQFPDRNLDRYFWAAAVCLLLLLAATLITGALAENQTIDENVHIAAGYSYLKTRDYRMNPEHPPLGKLICGIPLLVLNPTLPLQSTYWQLDQEHQFGREFLYQNRIPADTLLFVGRLGTIAVTVGFAAFLAFWVRRRFGSAAALLALTLFVFDSNILAHGRYITTDMVITTFAFITCMAWTDFVAAPSWRRLILCGVVLGLALASKYSSLLLFPILVAIYGFAAIQKRSPLSIRQMTGALAIATVLAFLVVFVSYGAVVKPLVSDALVAQRLNVSLDPQITAQHSASPGGDVKVQPLAHSLRLGNLGRRAVRWVATVPLPAHYYFIGLYKIAEHSSTGQPAYLLERYSQKGWWYFFPISFLVKTPSASLLLLLGCAAAGLRWLFRDRSVWGRVRELPVEVGALVLAPLIWFVLSCFSSINIGLRHILPVYPFLYVLVAVIIFGSGASFRSRRLWVAGLATIFLIAESWHVYPHHVAFFNTLSGGPANGPHYLLDSNIDWGQDLKNLKAYTARLGDPHICLSYWGTPQPEYYHVAYYPLPEIRTPEELRSVDCLAAVSVQLLYGEDGRYQALRELKPNDEVGYSIYLFDLRKSHPAISGTMKPTVH